MPPVTTDHDILCPREISAYQATIIMLCQKWGLQQKNKKRTHLQINKSQTLACSDFIKQASNVFCQPRFCYELSLSVLIFVKINSSSEL